MPKVRSDPGETKRRVRLLHWKASEAEPIVAMLRDAGLAVEYQEAFATTLMKQWREAPPDVFVVDLSRLPSQGREIATALRQSPKTRAVPIIFLEGDPAKVEALRKLLPDASYTRRGRLLSAVRHAKPVAEAARPVAMMNRFSGRTAAQKLGIGEDTLIRLINPPRDIGTALRSVPASAQFVESDAAVTLCFVHEVDELRRTIADVGSQAGKTRLWILWRKKSAPGHSGVTETMVRETGLALGLVDYKICSVDPNWSALLFAKRTVPPR